jgi:hypothetical protein
MGCRGGELTPDEAEKLENNEALCSHIKKNWEHYTDLADRAVIFCFQDGEPFHKEDVLSILKDAIIATRLKTGLSQSIKKSRLKQEKFVSLVARTVYESADPCSKAVMELLKKCRVK